MKKIRVILVSFDYQLLEKAAARIINSVQPTGAVIGGPVPLKTKKEIFTVLRSPHVNKDSREQFVQHTHKRLIDIYLPMVPAQTLDVLSKLELPMGVEASIKS